MCQRHVAQGHAFFAGITRGALLKMMVRRASTLYRHECLFHSYMPAAQWSRHSCLQFNKLFDAIARGAV